MPGTENEISLPQLAWRGVKELKLYLPGGWAAEICNMAGHDRPPLIPAAMKKAIGSPAGMKPLREYARGKKEVVILFDDMARVTRTAEIAPHVLAELAAAGIQDSRVRFICASGCHGAPDRADFVKKLGEDVLRRFPVYNHNPFANCVYAGTTTAGTKISLNAEVMKCDLKIGIGSVVPHIMAGFGGGSKIVLPGVAAYETVRALHAPRAAGAGEGGFNATVSGMGAVADNPRRRDIDEAAGIAGLDMIIDALVNQRGETVALFAGAPQPAYAAALAAAREHYLTPRARDKDIVIANAFAKASEAVSGLLIAYASVKQSGGSVVLIANAPEGQATHYLMGPFGNDSGGELQLKMKVPPHVARLIIYNEYPELAARHYLEDTDRVIMTDSWAEVIRLLKEKHGDRAEAAVYPGADIQYSRPG
ncbi:MAG: lactate racemase domain-containing protein [Dehalococcoidales bacterium]|jgi:nickel-dependent lactate racemase